MSKKVLIIAEAGVNHNGSLSTAKEMIDCAAIAGVDIVKFQTFKTEKLVSKTALKAGYQQKNIKDEDNSQFNMLKKLELDEKAHIELIDYCKKKGIEFLSTAFDEESMDLLDSLGVSLYKIPSGEITNKPYLEFIARKGKKIILSTGMSELCEVSDALNVLMSNGITKEMITVLHCNTEYPTPMKDVNLKAMLTMRDTFDIEVGYSDHTLGIEIPIAAVALGATVIEKHFTLDRNMVGPDHLASLEPDELCTMVKAIRNVEFALSGNGLKIPSNSEIKNIKAGRRSIYFAKDLALGTIICVEDLKMLRPNEGISPMNVDDFIGKKLIKQAYSGTLLTLDYFSSL